MNEIEAKIELSYEEYVSLDKKLLKIAVKKSVINEINYIYDLFLFPNSTFRLREENNNSYKFTYKGKVKSSKFKKRPEINIKLYSFLGRLLKKLPYDLVYYKLRKNYVFDGEKISLDHVRDLGYFIEIEGSESGIETILKKLNLENHEIIKKGYPYLLKRKIR